MEEFITLKFPKIKICGIKHLWEADYLNEAGVDYAGFVFYEKSKRNVSLDKAQRIGENLSENIKKVAVTVSPDESLVKAVAQAGFDLIQVHGELRQEVFGAGIPIWRAVNIGEEKQLDTFFLQEESVQEHIAGYVADGAGYGGGKPFDWEAVGGQVKKWTKGKTLVLAGGLDEKNVSLGITYFSPDVVDVSSSVEEGSGKSREKILKFVAQVRNC